MPVAMQFFVVWFSELPRRLCLLAVTAGDAVFAHPALSPRVVLTLLCVIARLVRVILWRKSLRRKAFVTANAVNWITRMKRVMTRWMGWAIMR